MNSFYTNANNRSMLRLYASLSSSQRAALFSDTGMSLAGLSSEQWEVLRKTFRNASVESGETPALFKGSVQYKEKGQPEYTIVIVSVADGNLLCKWIIEMPLYPEPPKPKPEPARAPGIKK